MKWRRGVDRNGRMTLEKSVIVLFILSRRCFDIYHLRGAIVYADEYL